MSCGQTQNDDEENPALPPALPDSLVCGRCSLPPVIQIRESGYCHECFLSAFGAKTLKGIKIAKKRSLRGNAKDGESTVKRGKKRSGVMIAFSGGASSRALLECTRSFLPAMIEGNNEKYVPTPAFDKVVVVFIDESGVEGYGDDRTAEIREIVEGEGFELVVRKLEDLYSAEGKSTLSIDSTSADLASLPSPSPSSSSSSSPLSRLNALLAPHSSTSRTSLHSSLLHSLLAQTALEQNCSILLTGEGADRIACQVISGMSQGRGWGMGEEVGVEWTDSNAIVTGGEEEGLTRVRPMGLCLNKEIKHFNEKKGLKSLVMKRPEDGLEPRVAGIESLVSAFVNGLEANFPSTVSTIIRTAGKLGMRSADDSTRGVVGTACPLCGLPAQGGAQEWRTAITISSFASPSITTSPSSTSSESIPLASQLCYGCLLLYQDIQQQSSHRSNMLLGDSGETRKEEERIEVLPGYVGEIARARWERERGDGVDEERVVVGRRVKTREEVREGFKEFLIED